MKISQIIQETSTTAGSIAPTEHGFVKMQSRNPSVYGGNKVGNLLKGKKTSKPFANSLNEAAMKDLAYDLQHMKPAEFQKKYGKTREEMKASMNKQPQQRPAPPVNEADLSEQDLIVVPGQGRSVKTGFVPHDKDRTDHEVEMAVSDLFSAGKNAEKIYNIVRSVSEEEGLEGWVQEKIIKANDYLNTVREYLEGKQVQGVSEGEDGVDSLVTDTEAIMDKFKIDALQALKIVLGEREYKDRPGFYNSFIRKIIARSKQQGLAEGYDPVESDYQQWEDILVKDGYRGDPSGAYALKLVVGHQLMLDPAEVASTIRNILTYVKQNRQVLGKAVSDRTTVKDAIIDIKNKFPQQYQAAQQPQGVAEAGFPGAPDVEMPPMKLSGDPQRDKLKQEYMDLHREIKSLVDIPYSSNASPEQKMQAKARIKQLNDRADQIKAILEPRQPPNEWQKKTYGYDDNWNRVGKGVAEGAKVDRMVKHVAQSEKKLGHSKKEAENIAWATANKRGMLDNKNKKK